jgi:predicted RNA-binding protein YlxR (DUF448 family)
MVPARTCLGCRLRADNSTLLRVVARDGDVVPDPSGTFPGRGGWVHPTRECIDTAIKRKAFGRALRAGALDAAPVLHWLDGHPTVLEEMAD